MITVEENNGLYLLRSDSSEWVENGMFESEWLAEQGLLLEEKKAGRASVYFFRHGQYEYVLRHYRRGGAVANISEASYLWTNLKKTRAWQELSLLQTIAQLRLPAPKPAAALVRRQGFKYSASLITYRLVETESFAAKLKLSPVPEWLWQTVGGTIRLFHDANIQHADLNADNILINSDNRVFLIDFDKSGIKASGGDGWKFDNLSRLQRSLKKQHGQHPVFHYSAKAWSLLAQGYASRYGVSSL